MQLKLRSNSEFHQDNRDRHKFGLPKKITVYKEKHAGTNA